MRQNGKRESSQANTFRFLTISSVFLSVPVTSLVLQVFDHKPKYFDLIVALDEKSDNQQSYLINRPFLLQAFQLIVGKITGETNVDNDGEVPSGVPVNHVSEPAAKHKEDPETGSPKWNAVVF